MSKFKVGDTARIVSDDEVVGDEFVGMICTIVAVGDFVADGRYKYIISVDGESAKILANDDDLESIIQVGSWDEIEATIGWNPTKVPT